MKNIAARAWRRVTRTTAGPLTRRTARGPIAGTAMAVPPSPSHVQNPTPGVRPDHGVRAFRRWQIRFILLRPRGVARVAGSNVMVGGRVTARFPSRRRLREARSARYHVADVPAELNSETPHAFLCGDPLEDVRRHARQREWQRHLRALGERHAEQPTIPCMASPRRARAAIWWRSEPMLGGRSMALVR